MRLWHLLLAGCSLVMPVGASSQGDTPGDKLYRVIGGKVDERVYNGFRRYHAGCNHCHGPDGVGSTFAPALVEKLLDTGRKICSISQLHAISPEILRLHPTEFH